MKYGFLIDASIECCDDGISDTGLEPSDDAGIELAPENDSPLVGELDLSFLCDWVGQCDGSGNARYFETCGEEEVALDSCVTRNSECVEISDEKAQCRCIGGWQGPECEYCGPGWDEAADCLECLPGWSGLGCDEAECVRYVKKKGNILGDGRDWKSAFDTVQAGIDSAATALEENPGITGCEVWVASGTYYIFQIQKQDTVQLREGVHLYGGFSGVEENRDDRDPENIETILDGRIAFGEKTSVFHVVTGSDRSLIDGFTIRAGKSDENGGGMYNEESTLLIKRCHFVNNVAAGDEGNTIFGYCPGGGAIYNKNSSPRIVDCTFYRNMAQGSGGAVFSELSGTTTIINSQFNRNAARSYLIPSFFPPQHGDEFNYIGGSGGAVSGREVILKISSCSFADNEVAGYGGALYSNYSTRLHVTNTTFDDNDARQYTSYYMPYPSDSSIAGGLGGALSVYGPTYIANSVFRKNTGERGGAISTYARNARNPLTIVPDSRLDNSVVWGNDSPEIFPEDPSLSINNCIIAGSWLGKGNIEADPQLKVASDGHWKPASGSPCIDAADSDRAPLLDATGKCRFDDPYSENTGVGSLYFADIGTHEYHRLTE